MPVMPMPTTNPLNMLRGQSPPSAGQPPTIGYSRSPRAQVPPQLRQAITTVAMQHGVDPAMMTAVLRQENGQFNPNLVGSSGEVGLFQIMPATALQYLQTTGNTPQERLAQAAQMLKDPHTNAQVAAMHLAHLSDMWPDDPRKVFAAYNGGPTAMANAERDAVKYNGSWEAALDASRGARFKDPRSVGMVKDYYSNTAKLYDEERSLQASQQPGPSSTGAQRAQLRDVTPPAPATAAIPTPASPRTAGAESVIPPPVTPPIAQPVGPPTPPERTPVAPALPPLRTSSLPGDYIAQDRGGAPPPGVPAERTPVTPPLGPGPLPGQSISATPPISTKPPRTPAQEAVSRTGDVPPEVFNQLVGLGSVKQAMPPAAGLPDLSGEMPPVLDRDVLSGAPRPVQPMPDSSKLPGMEGEMPPFNRDVSSGAPMPGPPPSRGTTGSWEPSLGTVPQDVRTPELPPMAPQADINTALGSLTDEELRDLYAWLQEQGQAPPPDTGVTPWRERPYYHMGGMPAVMPDMMPFAERSKWVWEGGR